MPVTMIGQWLYVITNHGLHAVKGCAGAGMTGSKRTAP